MLLDRPVADPNVSYFGFVFGWAQLGPHNELIREILVNFLLRLHVLLPFVRLARQVAQQHFPDDGS